MPGPAELVKVELLRPDTHGHNLVVKVIDTKLVVDKPARGSLKPQRVAECTVGDETGTILLTAKNDQLDIVKPGSYVMLRNAKVDMYRSSMRLTVGQSGRIEGATGHSFKPKEDFNMSLIEYELVPVPQPAAVAVPAAEQTGPAAAELEAGQAAEEEEEVEETAANGGDGFEEAEPPVVVAS